jgi:hypothetical protein
MDANFIIMVKLTLGPICLSYWAAYVKYSDMTTVHVSDIGCIYQVVCVILLINYKIVAKKL